ncbi:hypothetical protein FI667_g7416, partial [Globisporangium splendens]
MGSKRRRAVAEDADEALKQSIKKTSDAVKAVAEPNELPTKKTKKHKKNAASAEPASSVKADAPVMAATPPLSEESNKKKKKKKNKGSTSGAAASVAKPAAADNATVPAKKKSNEIDDLFQSLKSKKKEQIEAEEKQQREEKAAIKKKKKEKERLDEQIKRLEAKNTNSTAMTGKNPEARPVRYDQDGLPIYTEESLQINQGAGDTADCPFDCWEEAMPTEQLSTQPIEQTQEFPAFKPMQYKRDELHMAAPMLQLGLRKESIDEETIDERDADDRTSCASAEDWAAEKRAFDFASSGEFHVYDAIELPPSLLTRGPYHIPRASDFASVDAFLSNLSTESAAAKVFQDAHHRLLLFQIVQHKETRAVKGSDIVNVLHRLDLLGTVNTKPECAALIFVVLKTEESGGDSGCFEHQQAVEMSASADSSSPIGKRNPQQYAPSNDDASPVVMMNPVHIQAFGLEDHAEAVIAMGNRQWSLMNLSKWRSESLDMATAVASTIPSGAADRSTSSKEYVRQRQRAYMKQCLAGAKSASSS